MASPVTAGVGMAEEVRRPARALADALRGRTVSAPTGGGEGFADLPLLLDDGTVCVILGAAVSDARRGRPPAAAAARRAQGGTWARGNSGRSTKAEDDPGRTGHGRTESIASSWPVRLKTGRRVPGKIGRTRCDP